MGHAQIHEGRMKGDDSDIDAAQTPQRLNGRLALLEKSETLTDSIPNKPGIIKDVIIIIILVLFCGEEEKGAKKGKNYF